MTTTAAPTSTEPTTAAPTSTEPTTAAPSTSASAPGDSDDQPLQLYVALAPPGRVSLSTSTFPDGGPVVVSLSGDDKVTVRLSGTPDAGAHVFIERASDGFTQAIQLQRECQNRVETSFGLRGAALRADHIDCTSKTTANITVGLVNPNSVTKGVRKAGFDSVPYTVVLVNPATGKLADTTPTLAAFASPGPTHVMVQASGVAAGTFELRAIGVDGSVATGEKPVVPDCASAVHSTTPPGSPSNSQTATASPTATATSSSIDGGGGGSVSTPAGTSSSSTAASSSAVPTPTIGSFSAPPVFPSETQGLGGPISVRNSSSPRPSLSPGTVGEGVSPSNGTQILGLSGPLASSLLQGDTALVILMLGVSVSAMIGVTLFNASRR